MKTAYFLLNYFLQIIRIDSSIESFPTKGSVEDFFGEDDLSLLKEAKANECFTYSQHSSFIYHNNKKENVQIAIHKCQFEIHIHVYLKTEHNCFQPDLIEVQSNIIEDSSIGMVIHKKSGEIIEANKAAQEILGLSLNQLIGKESSDPSWRAIKPDSSTFPGEEHPAMIALKTGKSINNVEMGVYHPKKKEVRWILINAKPIYTNSQTKPEYVYAYFTDISEIKQFNSTLNNLVENVKNTKQNLHFEAQINESLFKISKEFINSKISDYDQKINSALNEIGELIQADLIGIFHYLDNPKSVQLKNSWRNIHVFSKSKIQFSCFDYHKSLERHSKKKNIKVYNSALNDKTVKEAMTYVGSSMKSVYSFPYFKKNDCVGYIQIEFHHYPKELDEQMEKLISLFLEALSEFEIKKELNQILDRNNRIINQSLNEIYMCNARDFKFFYANNSALKNIGYTLDELKKMTPLDFKPTYNKTGFMKLLRPLLSGEKELIEFETKHTRKNGSVYPIKINLQYFTYENDQFITAIVKDITQEKASRHRIEKNKLLIQSVFSQVNIPMIITSITNDLILDVNQAAEELFGISKDKILKLNQNDFNISKELINKEINALKTKDYFYYEYELSILGRKRTFDVHSSLIEIDGNQFIYKLIFDQTEAKKNLNKIIHQNKVLKKIAWTHSHELRAPIARLLTLSEVIDNYDNCKDEIPKFMSSIKETILEIDKVIHLISNLTNESKIIENQNTNDTKRNTVDR